MKKRDIGTCHYCKLKHDKVEAGGIFHCPNLMCTGPGNAWFRSTFESYEEDGGPNGSHTVDELEWEFRAKKYMRDKPNDGKVLIPWSRGAE